MASTIIFLRHVHSAANASDTLTGQIPGIGLSPIGKRQAEELVERIGGKAIDRLYLSPIERCQLTIDPWLRSRKSSSLISLEVLDGLAEVDFGEWSGQKLSALRRKPLWRDVQERPSKVRFPGGESFREVQRRAVDAVEEILAKRGNQRHLVVSHSDTIKLILAHFMGMKLDQFQTLSINPASFSIIRSDKDRLSLTTINNQGRLQEIL